MEGWRIFWLTFAALALVGHAALAIVVSVRGMSDLATLLRRMRSTSKKNPDM